MEKKVFEKMLSELLASKRHQLKSAKVDKVSGWDYLVLEKKGGQLLVLNITGNSFALNIRELGSLLLTENGHDVEHYLKLRKKEGLKK